MGALAYDLRRPAQDEAPRLFAVPGGAVAEPAPEPVADGAVVSLPVVAAPLRLAPEPAAAVAPVAAVRTLDDVVTGLFAELGAGRQSSCALCGGHVRPLPVAAGAAPAGRCDGCGSRYSE